MLSGFLSCPAVGKAKPAKHTAAEIAAKVKAATTNMGGGKAGLQDRKGGPVGHAKYKCPICMTAAPDLKSMQVCQRPHASLQAAKQRPNRLIGRPFDVFWVSLETCCAIAASVISPSLPGSASM